MSDPNNSPSRKRRLSSSSLERNDDTYRKFNNKNVDMLCKKSYQGECSLSMKSPTHNSEKVYILNREKNDNIHDNKRITPDREVYVYQNCPLNKEKSLQLNNDSQSKELRNSEQYECIDLTSSQMYSSNCDIIGNKVEKRKLTKNNESSYNRRNSLCYWPKGIESPNEQEKQMNLSRDCSGSRHGYNKNTSHHEEAKWSSENVDNSEKYKKSYKYKNTNPEKQSLCVNENIHTLAPTFSDEQLDKGKCFKNSKSDQISDPTKLLTKPISDSQISEQSCIENEYKKYTLPEKTSEEHNTIHGNICHNFNTFPSTNDQSMENKSPSMQVGSMDQSNGQSGFYDNKLPEEKRSSNSDNNSLSNDGSLCNEARHNIEEEISEESRLIQLNPSLREFDVLDDLEECEIEEGEVNNSNSSEYESDVNEELPVEDVDAMLEEGLPEKFKGSNKKEHIIKLKRKAVLEEIGYDHFDLLPEGWIQIMHTSGMPVYLHQKSRVCTMARPYYLGPGSSRNHKVPLSAIPCLQYRRALEAEKKNNEEKEKNNEQNKNHPEIQLMAAKIETSEENEVAQSLEAADLREYCKKVFKFKTLTLIPFKSWADRRKYVRMTKDLKKRQRPSLPGGTKLLKFPIQNPDGTNSRSKGEWIINPNGKSYVCILHEYVQHALKKHPKYQFKELENPATPYSATVFIGDMQYSVGMGASKKQAKVEAAKAALEVLIPEMKEKIERDSQFGMRSGIARRSQNNDISIFDQIRVEDPRVAEFCAKTTEPPPYAILLTCLSRNMGLGDIKVHYEMNSKKLKEDEFTMVVGNHKATVVCKNKRDGKQRAAQAILQALHPNITHWGSLLRMYGNRSIKSVKEKKQEEQEITGLQSKASLNQPNFAILEKLRTEMLKLKEKRDAIKAKGKFTPPENVILPSLSSTDLNKVNLT